MTTATDAELRIALPAELTIAQVSAWSADAAEIGPDANAMVVDASPVTSIDTAGIQLLLAIRREAARRHLRFRWQGVSRPLRDAAALAGLVDELGLETGADEVSE